MGLQHPDHQFESGCRLFNKTLVSGKIQGFCLCGDKTSYSLFVFILLSGYYYENNQQKSGEQDYGFVLIKIEKKYFTELIEILAEGKKHTVPNHNADGGVNGIGRIRLPACTSDKGNICTADWDDPAKTDRTSSVVAKSTVGGKNRFFGGWKVRPEFFH